jgi:predicted aspartyl protease
MGARGCDRRRALAGAATALALGLAGCGTAHPASDRTAASSWAWTAPVPAVPARVAADHVASRRHAVAEPAVVVRDGSEVAVYARITIAGRPYLFRVDTGDSRTVIYADAAAALHLHHHGASQRVQTVGCTISDQPVRVTRWRLGSLRLPRTTIVSQQEPGELADTSIGGITVAGLLGNDVLARLHSLTIEFRRRRLILGASHHRAGRSIPLTVHRAPSGAIDITVRATVNGVTDNYLIDSGAPFPLLDPGQSTRLGLTVTGEERDLSGGAGCTEEATPVGLDAWRIGSLRLPATTGYAAADAFTVPEDGHDVDGLIDAGTLSHFGQVTVQYGRGRLVLGGEVG